MSYVTLFAKARGIAVEPIDWYRDEDIGVDPPGDPAGEREFERDYGDLARRVDAFDSFATLNSPQHQRDFLLMENARSRLGVGFASAWHRRQAWMNERARLAIMKHEARRTVAFVGFAHRPELDEYLSAFGVTVTEPGDVPGAAQASGGTVPDEVVALWRAGIARMQARLVTTVEPAAGALRAKIRSWEVAVERRGACCVDEAAFAVH